MLDDRQKRTISWPSILHSVACAGNWLLSAGTWLLFAGTYVVLAGCGQPASHPEPKKTLEPVSVLSTTSGLPGATEGQSSEQQTTTALPDNEAASETFNATDGRELPPVEPLPSDNATPDQSELSPTRDDVRPAEAAASVNEVDALLQDAISRGEALAERFPDVPDAQETLARIYWLTGNFTKAEKLWKEIVQQTPNYAYAHHGLGQAAAKHGDFTAAAAFHERAAEIDPNYQEATLMWAAALTKIGKTDETIDVLTDFIERHPSTSAELKRGQAQLATKQFHASKKSFQKVLETMPENLEALSGMVISQSRLGQKEEAATSRERLQQLRKSQRETTMQSRRSSTDLDIQQVALASRYTAAGQVYFAKQHWNDAEEIWQEAFRLNPKDAQPLEQLAALYIGLGNADKALKTCEKLYTTAPNNAQYAFNYAMVLDRMQRSTDAIDVLEKLNAQAPSPQTLGMLADIHFRAGELTSASKNVERALQMAPQNPQLQSLQAAISNASSEKQ